jgi:hypothetical protein
MGAGGRAVAFEHGLGDVVGAALVIEAWRSG